MKTSTAICLLVALLSTSAHAEFLSGSKLYGFLEDEIVRDKANFETGVGSGYVVGVFDSMSGIMVCSPGNVTVKQVKQVVFNFMQKNPDLWDKSADVSVVRALREVWPCKGKGTGAM